MKTLQQIQVGISNENSKLFGRERHANEAVANLSGYLGYGLYTPDGRQTMLENTPFEYICKQGQFYGHLIKEVADYKPRYPVN